MCFNYGSHPTNVWWSFFDTICDMIVIVSVVVIYISTPIITKMKLRSKNCSELIINFTTTAEQILNRVKRISAVMLPCFFCTMFIGTDFCDFINYFSMISRNVEIIVFVIAYVSFNLTSVIVPIVYLIDRPFRNESIKVVSKFCFNFKRKLNFIQF